MNPTADAGGTGPGASPGEEISGGRILQTLKETLPEQRWFAEKSAHLRGISVADHGILGEGTAPVGWFLLKVTFQDLPDAFYSTFFREEGDRPRPAEDDPALADGLLAGLRSSARIPTRKGTLNFRATPGSGSLLEPAQRVQEVRRITSEQSNTSVVIDGRLIHKHLRRIASGENPDVEVPEYLWTRTSFRNVPRPVGSLHYSGPGFPRALVGVTQVFVRNEGDLWTHVLEELAGAGGTLPPSLLPLLSDLGTVTGQLHAALASATPDLPAFCAEPVREEEVVRWQAGWDATYQRARLELPEGLDRLTPGARALAEEVVRRLPSLPPKVALPREMRFRDSLRTRIHGDYHLGQVMRTATGLIILDFEGEPLRSLDERRAKQSPLKDVAGMLRSLDYAAHVSVRPPLPTRAVPSGDPSIPEQTSRQAQDRFLEGYWSVAGSSRPRWVDPKDPHLARLLEFFVTEKVLYELCYELRYRPAWTDIPLRALLQAMGF